MSRKLIIGLSSLVVVSIAALVLGYVMSVDAQDSNLTIKVAPLVRGGQDQEFKWAGGEFVNIELSTNGGVNWVSVGFTGNGDFKIPLPPENTNSAQVRLTLSDGSVVPSDLFSIDSTAPTTEVTGEAYLKDGKIMVPFRVIGPDAATVTLELKRQGGSSLTPVTLPIDQAMAEGFPAPDDDTYELKLTALDRVGNVETKISADIPDFRVDMTKPTATIDLAFPNKRDSFARFVMGGEKLNIIYTIYDKNVDMSSARIEVIEEGKARASIDPGADPSNNQQIQWTVPFEDWGKVQIRLTVSDLSENQTVVETKPFAIFASTPEVNIVKESSEGDNAVFSLAYLHTAGLRSGTVDLPWRVHIYEADWKSDSGSFVWNLSAPFKDGQLSGPNLERISLALQRDDHAYAARLIVGDGKNLLTERIPTQNTQPESIWFGSKVVQRISLLELPDNERIVNANRGATFKYIMPSGSESGTMLMLEYTADGGNTWLPITPEPIKMNLDLGGVEQSYTWANPPKDVKYATVRAVTQFASRQGVIYRIQDIMEGGLLIDGADPSASILRVIDDKGRVLQAGDYTNSATLDIEWRASDRGSAGLKHLVLWDNLTTTSQKMNAKKFAWNDKKFVADSAMPGSELREISPVTESYRVHIGGMLRPAGQVGFLIEAVDRAENRTFPGGPPTDRMPEFSVNVDRFVPQIEITGFEEHPYYRPGQRLKISWRAWDNKPDPLIENSMGAAPVSLHVQYKNQNGEWIRSTLHAGLPASQDNYEIEVPAFEHKEIQFALSAMDRAGNESLLATTPGAQVRNVKVPKALLEPPVLSDDKKSLKLNYNLLQGQADEIAKVRIWARSSSLNAPLDAAAPFREVDVKIVNGEFIFDLPEIDTNYEFAVTVENHQGLREPVPSRAEKEYEHDVEDPSVDLKIVDATSKREIATYIREDDDGKKQFPRIMVRVSDLHFDAKRVLMKVERLGVRGTEEVGTSKVINGEWVDIGPISVTRPEEITVTLSASDTHNRKASISKRLVVRDRPRWEITGLGGSGIYFTNTRHYLFWRSNGAISEDGKVSLSIQRYVKAADTGDLVLDPDYSEKVIALGVEDNGSYYLDAGLPSESGLYKFILRAKDIRGRLRETRSASAIDVIKPAPSATLHPLADLKQRVLGDMQLPEGETPSFRAPEYMLKLDGPNELVVEVKDDKVGWYPLPPASDGLRLEYRFQSPEASEPTSWVTRTYNSVETPKSVDSTLTLGSYTLSFPPALGEGRYEIRPLFRDIYGHSAAHNESTHIVLVFDAGPPAVTLESGLKDRSFYTEKDLKQLFAQVTDPLLVREQIELQYRNSLEGEWKAMKLQRPFKVDTQTGKSISGYFDPDFSVANRYYLRLMAKDELGQVAYAHLDGPVYAGGANYVASWPLPMNTTDEVYTNRKFSRRPNFRVRVDPVNPWPESVGLQSLTLWWRIKPENPNAKEDRWHPIDFKDRWMIGKMKGDWLLPGTEDHEISLPFTAERSGTYQFVVTSTSMYDQLEKPDQPAQFGKPRMIPKDTAAEYETTVYVAGSAVQMNMPTQGPNMVQGQVDSLMQGRIQQLETYEISWTYTTSKENIDNIEDVIFTLRFFNGEKWEDWAPLRPAPANDPRKGEGIYTTSSDVESKDMLGNKVIVRTYRAYWKCPPVVADVEGFRAKLRIKAVEQTRKNTLPAMVYQADSPLFRVGEPRPNNYEIRTDYYSAKMKDGNAQMEKGNHWQAIRHFRDARLEEDTSEANAALAKAYTAVGHNQLAAYHRDHAGRPGVSSTRR